MGMLSAEIEGDISVCGESMEEVTLELSGLELSHVKPMKEHKR